ncbi:thermonuclease family protein [Pseudobacillus badius]|uniref:thermonuclease family protein n=1 Tax=Bacillus badius TaxID=1455 RepID=UPI0007B3C333|nr:thermonuclease family protein [Bacillus badius]KZR56840.1 hypothetical protein A3781_06180 [Bacillus badius]
MKAIRYAFITVGVLFLLTTVAVTPWAAAGLFLFLYGCYQLAKQRNGKPHLPKPRWIAAFGILLSVILAFIFVEPVEEATQKSVETEEKTADHKQEKLTKKEKELAEREQALAKKEKELAEKEKLKEQKKEANKEKALPADSPSSGLIPASVTRVVDGDTIKITIDGRQETVRLILVDTPETKHPRLGVQPFGQEASAFTEEHLSGKEIKIEPGIQERDRYGRLLAYVYIDGQMFNQLLLEQGLARVAVYPPNTQYLDEMKEIEAAAKAKKIGIWSIENYADDDGYHANETKQQAPADKPPSAPPAPQPEPAQPADSESYQNCTELRKVHPDGVPDSHPAYESKHDRDNDRWACER